MALAIVYIVVGLAVGLQLKRAGVASDAATVLGLAWPITTATIIVCLTVLAHAEMVRRAPQ